MWYEIFVKGRKVADVFDTQDIIKVSCELTNRAGVNPDDIRIVEH